MKPAIEYQILKNSKQIDCWTSDLVGHATLFSSKYGSDPAAQLVTIDNSAENDAETAKTTQQNNFKTRFLELEALNDLTAAEVKELIRKLFKFLKNKGLFD